MIINKNIRTKSKLFLHFAIILVMVATVMPLQTGSANAAVQAPQKTKLKLVSHEGTTLTVKWTKVENCSGYQIQYTVDPDRIFLDKETIRIKSSKTTSKLIKKLSAKENYYVRIRAYKTSDGTTKYSGWTYSANLYSSIKSNVKNVDLESLKKYALSINPMEMRRFAKQKVGGFDTVQGACYAKGYVYYLLEDRTIDYDKGRCIIVKMNLKKKKIVKISSPLKLSHGNDMTFDTKRNRIVVAHSTPYPKKISVVNPTTLKIKYSKTVELPDYVKGMSNKQRGYYNGFGAIAYNRTHDRYVVLLRGSNFHHLLLLNSKFKPVKFMELDEDVRPCQTVQGMDSYGNFIVVSQSNGKSSNGKTYSHNNLLIYDWWGRYMSKMTIGTAYEIETVFHAKKKLYVFYYTSFYKGKKLQRDNYLYWLIKL